MKSTASADARRTDWSLLTPAVGLPVGSAFAAAYDQARGRVVVYLDYTSGPETWLWDGATWSRVHPQHQPPARFGAVAWSNFCSYFNCIPSFWRSTNGYVDECSDGTYSHSGGQRGACSYRGGEMRPLYGP